MCVESVTMDSATTQFRFHTLIFQLGVIEIVFLLLASFKSPGYCADMEGEEDMEKASLLNKTSNQGVQRGSVCKQCGIKRPLRSCHCSYCDRCVVRFDHHDVVINNCIGYSNQHYFVLFLLFALLSSGTPLFLFFVADGSSHSFVTKLYAFVRFMALVKGKKENED